MKIEELEKPAVGECLACCRLAWDETELGKVCNMTQPDGTRCKGVFRAYGDSE